jgi:hypothetical protein
VRLTASDGGATPSATAGRGLLLRLMPVSFPVVEPAVPRPPARRASARRGRAGRRQRHGRRAGGRSAPLEEVEKVSTIWGAARRAVTGAGSRESLNDLGGSKACCDRCAWRHVISGATPACGSVSRSSRRRACCPGHVGAARLAELLPQTADLALLGGDDVLPQSLDLRILDLRILASVGATAGGRTGSRPKRPDHMRT